MAPALIGLALAGCEALVLPTQPPEPSRPEVRVVELERVCPEPPEPECPAPEPPPRERLTLFGAVEWASVEPPGIELAARIDTGATTSSINGIDRVRFERDGEPWVRFAVEHPETGELLRLERPVVRTAYIIAGKDVYDPRPVVKLRARVGDMEQYIEFTVADRSGLDFQLLIGRNFLRDYAIVDVSRHFDASRPPESYVLPDEREE